MTNKTTKRALLASIVSLVLCFSMLLGTTYAWFTDSASTGINTIQSGNLDIVVSYAKQSDVVGDTIPEEAWTEIDATTPVFDPNALWEPGYTEVVYFKIENKGSLALKYKMSTDVAKETPGTNKDGKEFKLSDYLKAYHESPNEGIKLYNREEAQNPFGGFAAFFPELAPETFANAVAAEVSSAKALSYERSLEPKQIAYTTMVIFMPTTVGNEANYKTGTIAPSITFGINVVATQYTYETDAYGTDYDEKAEYPELADRWDGTADTTWYNTTDKTFTLSTAEQLAGLSVLSASGNTFSGKTIVLDSDMDFNGKKWTPIKQFSGTFDGGEHTVSNFTLDGSSGRAGFIQNLGQYPATVKNLTLSEVNGIAASKQYFGIVAANGHTSILENVHVVDCKIKTTHKEAWVGGIYGYFNWTSASNCTVENLEIDASGGAMFLGGFSGNMDQDLTINNVDIIGLKITVDATNGACQVGGFTGQTQTGHRQPTFNNCDVIGLDIVAKGEVQLGGFVGDAGAHTIANNCTVKGKIDASGVTDNRSFIGGFIADSGWNNNESNKGGHKLTNCSADVDIVTGGSTAGGFIGSTTAYHSDGGNRNMPITMTNCTATGTVTVASGASATVGGFAGEAERGTFDKCSTTSDTFIGKVWDGYTLNDDGSGKLTVTKN